MQTKSRKFLSVLLALLMMAGVISVAPLTASAAAAPGDKLFFGTYPQSWYYPEYPVLPPESPSLGSVYTFADGTVAMFNGNTYNKIEPIEWRVLASSGGKLLLLAEKLLDNQPYHSTQVGITWENSSIRVFLNGTFMTRAFGAAEQAAIQTTTVQTPDNQAEHTYGGNDTSDKLFLLSVPEVTSQYAAWINLEAELTAFADAYQEEGNKFYWWLRSPGAGMQYDNGDEPDWIFSDCAAEVTPEGNVFDRGRGVASSDLGVRPAMWVDASALPAPHTHAWSDWKTDAANHWKECACGEKSSQGAHTYGGWTVDIEPTADTAGSQHRNCTTCGYVDTQSIPATGGGTQPDRGIFGTNPKWYGAWWHYLLFFIGFGFLWMWF